MKQRDLVKKLETGGFVFDHHGSNHDIYRRGEDEFEAVERHKEIPERLARAILKRRGLKYPPCLIHIRRSVIGGKIICKQYIRFYLQKQKIAFWLRLLI